MGFIPIRGHRVRYLAVSDESAAEVIEGSRIGGMAYWRARLSSEALAAGEAAYLKQMELLKIAPKAFLSLDDACVCQWCRVAVERINRPY